jgi:hypothetical protein
LYRSGKLMYRARFGRQERISQYLLPMNISIESPEQKLMLTITYSEVELTSSIGPETFVLKGSEP